MRFFGTNCMGFKSTLSMRKRSEGTAVPKWWPLDHSRSFGEGNCNGDRKSELAGSLHKGGFHSQPFLRQDTSFSLSAVHKAGSQPLSLQYVGISGFNTMHLGFFG